MGWLRGYARWIAAGLVMALCIETGAVEVWAQPVPEELPGEGEPLAPSGDPDAPPPEELDPLPVAEAAEPSVDESGLGVVPGSASLPAVSAGHEDDAELLGHQQRWCRWPPNAEYRVRVDGDLLRRWLPNDLLGANVRFEVVNCRGGKISVDLRGPWSWQSAGELPYPASLPEHSFRPSTHPSITFTMDCDGDLNRP